MSVRFGWVSHRSPACLPGAGGEKGNQKLRRGNPTIHGHSPNRNPTIFKSPSWYRAFALSIVNCPPDGLHRAGGGRVYKRRKLCADDQTITHAQARSSWFGRALIYFDRT